LCRPGFLGKENKKNDKIFAQTEAMEPRKSEKQEISLCLPRFLGQENKGNDKIFA
jgi:hypothetical protein